MLIRNSKSGGNGINLYINGIGYHYSKYGNISQQKHSLLIPRTDYDKLVNYLKDRMDVDIYFSVIEYGEEIWYKFSDDKMIYIFDSYIYGHENHFEFKVDSGKVKMNKEDWRDLKIKNILENEI